MVNTTNLSYAYPGVEPMRFPDISVAPGESLLITGASGKGKTTLLHLLAGILRPASGSLSVSGVDLQSLSERELDKFRGSRIGLVLQQPHFIDSLNVLENIEAASYFATGKKNSKRGSALLDSLGIMHSANRKPAQLSVGQQQRLSIARALVNHPSLLLADEPTSSLDDDNAAQVAAMLSQLGAQNGSALIIVTHDHRLISRFPNSISL